MIKRIIGALLFPLSLAACVSNQTIQTIQPGDNDLSCAALKSELARLGVKFQDAESDSGVTGKNVGMFFLFWPGIIVNESRSNANQRSINRRISHLTTIYNRKCLGQRAHASDGLLKKLEDLKKIRQQGLISEAEYQQARKKLLSHM